MWLSHDELETLFADIGTEEILKANTSVELAVSGDPRTKRRPDYPIAALQQLIRNAVLHRNYESTNAPTRVYWFTDRIEILNPGGLFGHVTRENFGKTGATDYRNPALAEAMKVMGLVERFGVGIPTVRRELEANGNPPAEFSFEDTGVLVTVWGRKP